MVILKIFKNGITIDKINKFDINGKDISSNTTFLNKLIFIIIDYIKISVFRIYTFIKELNTHIYYLNIEIKK